MCTLLCAFAPKWIIINLLVTLLTWFALILKPPLSFLVNDDYWFYSSICFDSNHWKVLMWPFILKYILFAHYCSLFSLLILKLWINYVWIVNHLVLHDVVWKHYGRQVPECWKLPYYMLSIVKDNFLTETKNFLIMLMTNHEVCCHHFILEKTEIFKVLTFSGYSTWLRQCCYNKTRMIFLKWSITTI